MMIYAHYVILGLVSLLFAILVSNLIYVKGVKPGARPSVFPLVSILVPARNEEGNIKSCVRSLLGQDYPNFELIVLDDHSNDGTLRILKRIAAEDSRLKVLCGETLPVDWLGKCFACYQLSSRAQGEYLLFTDADTVYEPGALSAVMAAREEDEADFLTLITGFEMKTWAEKLILPLIYFMALVSFPLPLAKISKNPFFSIGNGQFMLFRKDIYKAIGGHESVRTALVEDIWLARRVKAAGFSVSIRDGSKAVSCRMYHNLGEIWEGFSKNVFAVVNFSLGELIAVALFFTVIYLIPPILLCAELWRAQEVLAWFFPAVEVFIVVSMRLLLAFRFRLGMLSSFFHPLGILMVLGISLNSACRILRGQGVAWKGRTYRFYSQKL